MTVRIDNLTRYWANSSQTQYGLALNVIDTGHEANSRLLILKFNGNTVFDVDSNGKINGITTSSGGASTVAMDRLTIATTNVFPTLTNNYSNTGIFILTVNGVSFTPSDPGPIFTVAGNTITWISNTWSVNPGDSVVAIYDYGNTGSGGVIYTAAFNMANAAYIHANDAYNFANTISAGGAGPAFNQANLAYTQANAAYNAANAAAGGGVTSAFNQANAAYDLANQAYNYANTINTIPAYTQANAAYILANAAYNYSNTINIVPSYNQANSSYNLANAAYNSSNTKLANTNGITFAGNTNVPGYAMVFAGIVSSGQFTSSSIYSDGTIVDYVSPYGRISVGSADGIRFYSNGAGNTYFGGFESNGSFILNTSSLIIGTINTIAYIDSANSFAYNMGVGANTLANSAYNLANAAYIRANVANTFANTAYLQANAAYNYSNTAYLQANAAYNYSNTAFVQGNTARNLANTALQNTTTTLAGTLTVTSNVVCKNVKTTGVTVASLPTAATAGAGSRAFVTDANQNTFYANVFSGGANQVPVFSDGTFWRIG